MMRTPDLRNHVGGSLLPPAKSAACRRWLLNVLVASGLFLLGAAPIPAAEAPASEQAAASPTPSLLEGEVIAIVDGDTLHVATEGVVYVVDLAGIDAPEKGQPSGDMAAQVLHLKVLNKQVQVLTFQGVPSNPNVRRITPVPTDTKARESPGRLRGRLRGILYCNGCINAELVREGIVWHDPREYPSKALAEAQERAKTLRRGLWQGGEPPIPPWQWREQQKQLRSQTPSPLPSGQINDLSRFFEAQTPRTFVEASAAVPSEPAPAAKNASVKPASEAAPAGDYWLTTSSGIRHNSKCRYYKKSKGRPCGANEGRPCKKCGG